MFGSPTDNTRASTIAFILAFIASAILFISDRGSERLLLRTQTNAEAVTSPGLAMLSKPLRGAESLVAEFKDRSRALEENKSLREELYALREDKQRAELIEMKLRRFEEILGADSGLDIPAQKIAARAVSEIEGPFVRSALINAGRKQGLKKGHPVMTVEGLYGHILRAGPKASRVLLLGDLNSRISVMSMRSSARAILSGDNSDLPRLAFVDDRADWADGDKVITSGDDGVMPAGLPIGVVKEQAPRDFVVELYSSQKNNDWVWVYPYEPIVLSEATEDDLPDSDQVTAADGPDEVQPETLESQTLVPQPGTP
ncbi:rod shape-determining protein MreC [Hellea balneolensis]|uniref:rod shape-determining protein MreC n=1 Tax=Hellea balneolensis TaxID=287478 RepID=UPI000686D365|nr:rod shape-determining protein MreC [Hellea balneolensis]